MRTKPVSEKKVKQLKDLVADLKKYKIIGVCSLKNMPTKQLQKLRPKLKEADIKIKITKKTLMALAFEQLKKEKPGIEKLSLLESPALLLSNTDPFRLSKVLGENTSKAPAKAGQIAPFDLIVPAGKTPFTPGPVIGELGALGIKTKVEEGKLAIITDTTVVKQGQKISEGAASILKRLGVEPMELGLNLLSAYEEGKIYEGNVLRIDVKEYLSNLILANSQAVSLAFDSNILIPETVKPLLSKAHSNAFSLSVQLGFFTSETKEIILKKAESQAMSVAKEVSNINKEALSKELQETIIQGLLV